MMSDWRVVFKLQDIPVDGARLVATPGGDIAIWRTGDGRIIAVEDDAVSRPLMNAPHDSARRFDVHVSDGVILLNMAGMGLSALAS